MDINEKYFELRDDIIRWLRREPKKRNYQQGLDLLGKIGFKPALCRRLKMAKAENPTLVLILTQTLRDAANFYRNPNNPKYEDVIPAELEVVESGTHQSVATESAAVQEEQKEDKYPKNISLVFRWFGDAYKRRDILHREMRGVGEGNDAASMARRKDLSERINSLSDYMDKLYQHREAYNTSGIVPTDEQIEQLRPIAKAEPPAKIKGEESSSLRKKEEDYASMDREQLMKRVHSLQTVLTKKRNLLLYQTERRKDKENPMPICPRRTKIEAQVRIIDEKLFQARSCLAKFG